MNNEYSEINHWKHPTPSDHKNLISFICCFFQSFYPRGQLLDFNIKIPSLKDISLPWVFILDFRYCNILLATTNGRVRVLVAILAFIRFDGKIY